jgi:uncharacterized protein involved in exopolysaccharide biosynthesis
LHTEYKYEPRHEAGYGDSEKNAFEYIDYLRLRWRLIAAACVSAVILSLGVSLLLPKRYTATASIVIEPPAGNDVRTATAVSPVYLESLKSYERFADSDTLFAGAAEHFHLVTVENPRTIESLKQQVLKVTKLRDTKILEISATLPEPALAQQFVQYVAEETIKLSRGESLATDREMIGEAERQSAEAKQRLDQAQQAWALNAARQPSGALKTQIESEVDLVARLSQTLVDVRSTVADYQEKKESSYAGDVPGLQARADELAKKVAQLEKDIEQKSELASRRESDRQKLEVELKMAQTATESSAVRLRELRATAGMRGERLRVIDPGIVPQRPSSPNVALNVAAALLLTLIALVGYLSISFSYHRRRAG